MILNIFPGEKIKPLVIGKSSRPRCFSRVKVEKLPVQYKANRKAWMTSALFEEWLHWFDRQMNGRKVLLFVDNAPSHGLTKLKNVTVKFLPKNTTSHCQPMDQGIIQAFKLKYRKKQLQHVVSKMEVNPTETGPELLRKITILDSIYWLARAWKEVETLTIVKCFEHAGFFSQQTQPTVELNSEDSEADDDDDIPLQLHVLARQLFDCDIKELINIDRELCTCDSEQRDWNKPASELLKEDCENNKSDDDDENDDVTLIKDSEVCSVKDCVEFVEKMREFASFHGDMGLLQSVMDLSDNINKYSLNKCKQSKISDFFKVK